MSLHHLHIFVRRAAKLFAKLLLGIEQRRLCPCVPHQHPVDGPGLHLRQADKLLQEGGLLVADLHLGGKAGGGMGEQVAQVDGKARHVRGKLSLSTPANLIEQF